jgi:hypothetical protein
VKPIFQKERRIMKIRNQYLILAVITTILTVPAFAEIELPLPENTSRPLIGQPFPQLTGVEQLYVVIVRPHVLPDTEALHLKNLEQSVRDKLKEARITVAEDEVDKIRPDLKKVLLRRLEEKDIQNLKWRSQNIPELRIDIDVLKLTDLQRYVFRIQTSLARAVCLSKQCNPLFKADVWEVPPVMQVVSVQNMSAKVTSVVLEQVDAFIVDYLTAYIQNRGTADVNDTVTVVPPVAVKQTRPPVKTPTTENKFVASKNSKVFHKPNCSSAKRIKPENLVTYSTRQQAAEAGKRPCKRCEP